MTDSVLTTGAIFDLQDRFSGTLDKLFIGLSKAEGQVGTLQKSLDRLGIGGMAGLSSKFAAEWAEVGKVTEAGVDATLKKMDRLGVAASPVFDKIPAAAKLAFGEVETLAAALPDSMAAKMAAGMDLAAGKMFSPIVAASKTASAEAAANLAGMTGAVEAAAGKMQAAGAGSALERKVWGDQLRAPRSGAFGRSGHGSGLHFGRVGGEIGGVHISTGGNAVMAAAGLALDGVYEAAQIDDAVAKALMTSQIPIGPGVSKTDAGKRIHDAIQNSSRMTGFGFHDTGEAVLEGQRLLSQMDFGKRNDLIESIMPSAAYEARQKGSTLPEAIEAIIGIAHQTQTYDPAGIQKIAKSLAYTSLLTPSPLPQFQGALGYSMPELHNGLDMDPSTIMLLTATMQQSGIKGTKSGTWLRSFFENSEPGSEEHNEALRKLGMLNGDNKPSWRTTGADGKVDWQASVTALSGILQRDQQTIPVDERIGLLRKAYGERGAGFASLMMGEKFTDNLAGATKGMNSFKGGEDMLAQYASASVLQQGRLALQDFNVAVSDLGTKLMPGATKAVSDFSEIMRTFDKDGPKGFLKLFYDKAIAPDLAPIAKQLTPGPNALQFKNLDPGADATGLDAMRNGLLHKESFTTGAFGFSNDNGGVIDTLAQGVFKGLSMYASGGAAGSGSGFINASYGGGGGFGGGGMSPLMRGAGGGGYAPGGLPALGHGTVTGSILSRGQDAMGHLMSMGVSREAAAAIVGNAQQESSISGHGPAGDHGTAHGMFQWRFDRFSALQRFAAARGKPWQDEHTELEFMVEEAKKRGNAGWLYGHDVYAANQGMQRFEQYGESPDHGNFRTRLGNAHMWLGRGDAPTVAAPKPRVTPGAPAAGATQAMRTDEHHHHIYMDGDKVAYHVTKRQVAAMEHPNAVGGPDTYGSWQGPATPLNDAA